MNDSIDIEPKASEILIVGKKTRRITHLKTLLDEHFKDVFVLDAAAISRRIATSDYNVIIVTDSTCVALDRKLLTDLKTFWPQAKLLCLVDRITGETEIAVRSAGVIFLGTYEHFTANCLNILELALQAGQPRTSEASRQNHSVFV